MHFVVRSVMRGLLDHRNCCIHRATTAAMGLRRFEAAEMMRHLGVEGGFGGLRWWRMMASEAAGASTPSESSTTEKEKEKENSLTEAKKREYSVVASSYWGIPRRRITREDGTEWPWNSFMVRNGFDSEEIHVHFMILRSN